MIKIVTSDLYLSWEILLLAQSLNQHQILGAFLAKMIFTFVLLLQLVFHFNVEGKHYLVETKNEKSPEKNSPVGQVVAFTFLSDQTRSIKV